MAFTKHPFIATSLVILALLSESALAATVQTPECDILGDPDVYGPGVRYGFYMQWASIVIFQFLAPLNAEIMRPASAVTVLAVYINTLRNLAHSSLVTIDWPILWFLTFLLVFFNLPTSAAGVRRTGGSLFTVMMVLAIYYLASPWIIFKGWHHGRQPGCTIKNFIFTSVDAYAHGWVMFLKVTWSIGVFMGVVFVVAGFVALGFWFASWGENFEGEEEAHPALSFVWGLCSLTSGPIAIASVEMTIKINHITFPGTQITDSGQLIALLIGAFTLFAAIISAVKATVRS